MFLHPVIHAIDAVAPDVALLRDELATLRRRAALDPDMHRHPCWVTAAFVQKIVVNTIAQVTHDEIERHDVGMPRVSKPSQSTTQAFSFKELLDV